VKPFEIQIALSETIIQELLWRALRPDAIMMMPSFNAAVEQQIAQIGPPPAGAQVAGISVFSVNDQLYAEITYTQLSEKQAG
jgi:hypothetical protein